jgi:hypothetical protein
LQLEASFAAGRTQTAASTVLPFAAVVGLAADNGGYFATTWGWAALAGCWILATACVVKSDVALGGRELVFAGALLALTIWAGISTLWSSDMTSSVHDAERLALYAVVALTVAVGAAPATSHRLFGSVTAGTVTVAAFSLATRLFPDRVGVFDPTSEYRLATPIGYWNGLAIFCMMGAIASLGYTAHGRHLVGRAAAGASVVVLIVTAYFTFGRAAWIALGAGLAAALVLDSRRLWLATTGVAVAAPTGVGLLIAARTPSLTTSGAPLAKVAHDGHRVAVAVILLALVAGGLVLALAAAETRVAVGPALRRGYAFALVGILVLAAAAGVVALGGPVTAVDRGRDAFVGRPPGQADLNARLFSFSGNGRADLWRIAWNEYKGHELLGAGAGTYGRYYQAHQPPALGTVNDAHNLYLETLAELGPIGVVALLTALASPFLALRSGRMQALVPAALGAVVAFLVHAAVDWDWELPAVTLVPLLLGGYALLQARKTAVSFRRVPTRALGLAVAAAVGAFSLVGLLGNSALATSDSATAAGNYPKGERYAHRATTWMPWSGAPWRALGAARRSRGEIAQARSAFARAAAEDSGDWRAWYGLALTSRGSARRSAFRKAVLLNPRGALRLPPAAKRSKGTS